MWTRVRVRRPRRSPGCPAAGRRRPIGPGPEQRERAPGTEHTSDLGESLLGVEVVERVPDDHGVGLVVVERIASAVPGTTVTSGRFVSRTSRMLAAGSTATTRTSTDEPARAARSRPPGRPRAIGSSRARPYPPDRLGCVGRAQLVVVSRVHVLEAERIVANRTRRRTLPDAAARTPARRPPPGRSKPAPAPLPRRLLGEETLIVLSLAARERGLRDPQPAPGAPSRRHGGLRP